MTTAPQTTRVSLAERSYDILIGSGTLAQLSDFLRERASSEHAVLVTDTTVDELYADALGDGLVEHGWEVHVLIVEPGEASKSVGIAEDLWNTMLEEGADRESIVVAVGGGVVGDLAGWVAASFARGVPFFQVPTTLLAQVDSSVGGKVGVNLPDAKNMVGAFWQPHGVLIDVDVLDSLPEREYRAGLAEVVKYGVILDESFFAFLEANAAAINDRDAATLTTVVQRCCRLKADVVEEDEREISGRRAILNYGHTFAHAFEAAGEYGSMLHGEAVAAGMRCAAALAERLGKIDAAVVQRQEKLLEALQLKLPAPGFDPEELVQLMYHDKKVSGGELRFVLPAKIGHVELVRDIADDDVAAVIKELAG
ncbi:MAG: 3-dehydroquinate synthase [Planctomycetaceae bacterium]|nr:3-dehydroquinate synthase [Planctomycetaceae bacterium]